MAPPAAQKSSHSYARDAASCVSNGLRWGSGAGGPFGFLIGHFLSFRPDRRGTARFCLASGRHAPACEGVPPCPAHGLGLSFPVPEKWPDNVATLEQCSPGLDRVRRRSTKATTSRCSTTSRPRPTLGCPGGARARGQNPANTVLVAGDRRERQTRVVHGQRSTRVRSGERILGRARNRHPRRTRSTRPARTPKCRPRRRTRSYQGLNVAHAPTHKLGSRTEHGPCADAQAQVKD